MLTRCWQAALLGLLLLHRRHWQDLDSQRTAAREWQRRNENCDIEYPYVRFLHSLIRDACQHMASCLEGATQQFAYGRSSLLLLACTEFCGRFDAVQTVQLYAWLFSTKQKQTGNLPAAAAQGSPFFAVKSACEALFE
jgi:hypothetical protein